MKRRHLCTALLLFANLGSIASADFGHLAVGGRTGGLGFGDDVAADAVSDLDGHFNAALSPFRIGAEAGGMDFGFDLQVITFPLTLDWYPFHNGLRFSGGLMFNRSEIGLDTHPEASATIPGHACSAADLCSIQGKVNFRRIAPYVGIGWADVFGRDGHWGILADLSVAFLGRSSVTLSATGPIASDPAFRNDLAREAQDIENDLDQFRFYPVCSISLFYRF